MIEVKLYTERFSNIPELVSTLFENFTLTKAIGVWKGFQEHSTIITLIIDDTEDNRNRVNLLAAKIKRVNNQEAVLITTEKKEARLA